MKAFLKEFKDFSEKVPRGGHKVVRDVAKEWFAEVVQLSPVDTGYFQHNWKTKRNSRPPSTTFQHPSPGKGKWGPARTPAFSTLRYDDKLYIYNQVAYGPALENGRSDQAPRNFFENSSRRANRKLQRRLKRLKWSNGKLKK